MSLQQTQMKKFSDWLMIDLSLYFHTGPTKARYSCVLLHITTCILHHVKFMGFVNEKPHVNIQCKVIHVGRMQNVSRISYCKIEI